MVALSIVINFSLWHTHYRLVQPSLLYEFGAICLGCVFMMGRSQNHSRITGRPAAPGFNQPNWKYHLKLTKRWRGVALRRGRSSLADQRKHDKAEEMRWNHDTCTNILMRMASASGSYGWTSKDGPIIDQSVAAICCHHSAERSAQRHSSNGSVNFLRRQTHAETTQVHTCMLAQIIGRKPSSKNQKILCQLNSSLVHQWASGLWKMHESKGGKEKKTKKRGDKSPDFIPRRGKDLLETKHDA